MIDTILHIHNAAMDLVDLARLKKAKDGDNSVYNTYLKAAYELELYAANKFTQLESDNDFLWKASLLRNAGWLATKCGYYQQALRLTELGLKIPTDNYELSKLEDLKQNIEEKLNLNIHKEKVHLVSGVLSAADLNKNQIIIQDKKSGKTFIFSVSKEQIVQLIRYFLGDTVEIEFQKNESGISVLKDIRLAA
ncbi:MAG: hypothetical protein AB8G86_10805 [Saprospiraceae bacterium]